ncbi:MAG TPA: DUF2269 family protein [Gaiellaceae bacterium]|nr:DUF2269 family protein [Gaiellaceae bacterium]
MENTAATTAERQTPLLPTLLVAAAFLVVAIVFCASSSWYLTFKAVHVGFAVIWIGGGLLLTVLGVVAERQNDAEGLAAIAKQAALVGEKLFSPASVIVLAAGIAMMVNLDWGWEHFWVVAGLIGFASTFVTGVGFLSPRSKRLHELMQTAGPTAPETQAAISEILLIARIDVAVLLLVVVDMVVKPFST